MSIAFYIAAVFAFIMAVLPKPPLLPGEPSDKVLHLLAFSVLGGLAALGFPRSSVWRIVLALAFYGALIELVQAIPALNRDSEILDLAADTLAALFAASCIRAAMTMRKRRD